MCYAGNVKFSTCLFLYILCVCVCIKAVRISFVHVLDVKLLGLHVCVLCGSPFVCVHICIVTVVNCVCVSSPWAACMCMGQMLDVFSNVFVCVCMGLPLPVSQVYTVICGMQKLGGQECKPDYVSVPHDDTYTQNMSKEKT